MSLKEINSRDKLHEMFLLQNKLNIKTAGEDWNTNEAVVFENAIIAEAGELLEALGYKWWKHQDVDFDNAKVEVVDLWHFVMSLTMQYYGIDDDDIEYIVNMATYPMTKCTSFLDPETLLGQNIKELVHVSTSYDAYEFDTIFFKFAVVMVNIGMDLDSLYSMYIIKNALNKFRQDNGYTTGTYQKIWNGREDNEVAMEQCQGLTYEDTLVKLAEIYNTL